MKRFLRNLVPALLLLAPLAASAAITLLPPCTKDGNCGISDILAVFVNVAEYLLGISGAVALGFFVYGGFVFVLSRGNKAEVDKAFGILKSAVTGIAIIFLSGVLIRFTTQALTGGVSKIPTIGETCDSKARPPVSKQGGDGLWISIPAGFTDPADPSASVVREGLQCIPKDDCKSLNVELQRRNRTESYDCIPVSAGSSCVRGLCPSKSADYACCLK